LREKYTEVKKGRCFRNATLIIVKSYYRCHEVKLLQKLANCASISASASRRAGRERRAPIQISNSEINPHVPKPAPKIVELALAFLNDAAKIRISKFTPHPCGQTCPCFLNQSIVLLI
jgi:hypothetical protein